MVASQSQPISDALAGATSGAEPSAALLATIETFRNSPPTFAVADKRGKFPMAALSKSADGASFDTVPITHACTAESFQKIKDLVAALVVWQQGLTAADTSDVSDQVPGRTA